MDAFKHYHAIVNAHYDDKLALSMLQLCAFLSGQIESLEQPYQAIYNHYKNDPDFLGMYAFFYCHVNRQSEAAELIKQGLAIEPHNAWLQHIYAHALNENEPEQIQQGIKFLEARVNDWPKQSRFFEGHNSMHLAILYLKAGYDTKLILELFPTRIWGTAKEFSFEQNNAFLVLFALDLVGYDHSLINIGRTSWQATRKTLFIDYFTPYLTVTAILSVAKTDPDKAKLAIDAFAHHAANFKPDSPAYYAWHTIALPVLQGCFAYMQCNDRLACEYLAPVYNKTRVMGHSDEQRSVFPAIYNAVKHSLENKL